MKANAAPELAQQAEPQTEVQPHLMLPIEAAAYYAESGTHPEAWQEISGNFDKLTEIATTTFGPERTQQHIDEAREKGYLIPSDIDPSNTDASLQETWSRSERKHIEYVMERYLDPNQAAKQNASEHLDANMDALEALSKINNTLKDENGNSRNYTFNDLVKTETVKDQRGFPVGKRRVYNSEILEAYTQAALRETPVRQLIEDSLREERMSEKSDLEGRLYNYQDILTQSPGVTDLELLQLQNSYLEQKAIVSSKQIAHPEAVKYIQDLWISTHHTAKETRDNIRAFGGVRGAWKNRKMAPKEKAEERFIRYLKSELNLTPEVVYAVLKPRKLAEAQQGTGPEETLVVTWQSVLNILNAPDKKTFAITTAPYGKVSRGIPDRNKDRKILRGLGQDKYTKLQEKIHAVGIDEYRKEHEESEARRRRLNLMKHVGATVLSASGQLEGIKEEVRQLIRSKFEPESAPEPEPEETPASLSEEASQTIDRLSNEQIINMTEEDAQRLFPNGQDLETFNRLRHALISGQEYVYGPQTTDQTQAETSPKRNNHLDTLLDPEDIGLK